jgi:L-alanine-DL-glutamate epimerase-like enolase superfamily enzyme
LILHATLAKLATVEQNSKMRRGVNLTSENSGVSVIAARLRLPLTVPYRLVFGDQHNFDVLLVGVIGEGRTGWGEATILPGYTDETIEQSWELAARLVGACRIAGDLQRAATGLLHTAPFTATAFLTALDWLRNHPTLKRAGRFDLLGTVNGKAEHLHELEKEIEILIGRGYKTLKVKAGWDPDADLKQVDTVRHIVNGRAKLRIDGNQGYKRDQAIHFLKKLKPESIELVEQPCPAEDWESACALVGAGEVPLMLDESIYSIEDIDRAAALKCADYIKLKLMKFGTLDALETGLRRIEDHGMKAVLGNGVATDLGCWMELCVGLDIVTTAGEMNGFLKTPVQLLVPALKCDGPTAVIDDNARHIDMEAVNRYACERVGDWDDLPERLRSME